MRRIIFSIFTFIFLTFYSLLFSSCGFIRGSGFDVYNTMDQIAGKLGNSQITPKSRLAGERLLAEDDYTGIFTADCDNENGRDVIFGGASIKERQIHIYGKIQCDIGGITLRVRETADVFVVEPQKDGTFDKYLDFSTGGNYIMADYENFSGKIELVAEYAPDTEQEENLYDK